MADLSDLESSQTVKIVGASVTGLEQTPVESTNGGGLHVNLRTASGTEVDFGHAGATAATLRTASQIGVGGQAVSDTNRVPSTDILNIGIVTAEKTSTATASIVRVGASNLVGRKALEIVNTSNVAMYVGASNVAVSGANRGRPIDPKASFYISLAANVNLYIISASSATYVVTEVG